MEIKPVAHFRSPVNGKFGLPRQAGLAADLEGDIIFGEEFRSPELLRGLEGYDYIWLIWGFHLNRECSAGGRTTVRPPRLGGNERMGIFATRSPYRPNPIGLSSVRITEILPDKGMIRVAGADLADGTPIFDIKPYVEYADSHTGVRSGFTDTVSWQKLSLRFDAEIPCGLGASDRSAISGLIMQDPRPRYHHDPDRLYHLGFKDFDISFKVSGTEATVTGIKHIG